MMRAVLDAAAMPTSIFRGFPNGRRTSGKFTAQSVTPHIRAFRVDHTVNGGTVTYTVTDSGSAQVGLPVTSGIVSLNLAPPTTYTLPANTLAGTYTINASYLGADGSLNTTGTGALFVGISTVTQ